MSDSTGRMLVISGPSGAGKSTICKKLLEDPRVEFSVSATTRKPRPGEVDGRDYRFIQPKDFRRMISEGAFLEHAEVYGNLYGTLRAPVREALSKGHVYLLEIDVQGANQLRALGEPGERVDGVVPKRIELFDVQGGQVGDLRQHRLAHAIFG